MANDPASRGRLPAGLSFFDPVALVSTVGGIGLLPVAPGTWGSLVALPVAWLIHWALGPLGLVAGVVVVTAVGSWVAGEFGRRSGFVDPGPVVIDEVAGQWLVLCVAPREVWYWIAGFLLFRAFDIFKPWPAGWADRQVKGGFGVMLDDLIAALYGAIILYIVVRLAGGANVFA